MFEKVLDRPDHLLIMVDGVVYREVVRVIGMFLPMGDTLQYIATLSDVILLMVM